MKTYTFTCECGDAKEVEAETREEAVSKMKAMMTDEKIKEHMSEKHPGKPVPSAEEVAAMVEKGMKEKEA